MEKIRPTAKTTGKDGMRPYNPACVDLRWLIAEYVHNATGNDSDADVHSLEFWSMVIRDVLEPLNVSAVPSQLQGEYYCTIFECCEIYGAAISPSSSSSSTRTGPSSETEQSGNRNACGISLNNEQWVAVKSICEDSADSKVLRRMALQKLAADFERTPEKIKVGYKELNAYYKQMKNRDLFDSSPYGATGASSVDVPELLYKRLPSNSDLLSRKGYRGAAKLFKGTLFCVILLNKNWITIAESAKLEYLLKLHGGEVEKAYEDFNVECSPRSSPVVVICVGESKSAAVRALKKWGKLYSPLLVETAIKARSFIASNLEEFVFDVNALRDDVDHAQVQIQQDGGNAAVEEMAAEEN